MINLNGKWTKTDLLALPYLESQGAIWDTLLIVPTRKKQVSGWSRIALIGCVKVDGYSHASDIIALPDDIEYPMDEGLRMDSYHPQGVLRLWSNYWRFTIDYPGSSVSIRVIPKGEK